MVRVTEALTKPVDGDHVCAIRWTSDGYILDRHSLSSVDMTGLRQFSLRRGAEARISVDPSRILRLEDDEPVPMARFA